ncbi:MAG: DUF2911 domain-containing protein [Ignavibacteriales bacterium]|nr:DUF2911 domain-containing protein [Ignavibacteriales bacterium]
MKTKILIFVILIFLSEILYSQSYPQTLTMPMVSPKAQVMQRIGLTDIVIDYHRPGVKGRLIWGGLVPYGIVWRAGANENTTISFSDDVKINGQFLPAGNYGLHIIPNTDEWTIIFSKVYTAWGSFFYDEKDDALRIIVKPTESQFVERLCFRFDNLTDSTVNISLNWENLKIQFSAEVNVFESVIKSFRKELVSILGFYWYCFYEAANYCYHNNVNLTEALEWVEQSIKREKNFLNLTLKAQLMQKLNEQANVAAIMDEALEIATESELNQYGEQLLSEDNVDKAIEIFKLNTKRNPNSWVAFYNLGEAFIIKGDKNIAGEYLQKALSNAPANEKEKIKTTLQSIKQ